MEPEAPKSKRMSGNRDMRRDANDPRLIRPASDAVRNRPAGRTTCIMTDANMNGTAVCAAGTTEGRTFLRMSLAWVAWVLSCFAAAATGVFVSVDGWYAALHKPSWNPPDWVFGPVWTTLYLMMATAAWLVWRQGGWARQGRLLGLFVTQLALNALWTPLFFGLHSPPLAFACIIALWIAVAMTARGFRPVSRPAALLLLPYQLWISFAAVLNFAIWRLNA